MYCRQMLAAVAVAAPLAAASFAGGRLPARQDGNSCASKYGPSFEWCEGVDVCVDESAGYTCCINVVCNPGGRCDGNGGCGSQGTASLGSPHVPTGAPSAVSGSSSASTAGTAPTPSMSSTASSHASTTASGATQVSSSMSMASSGSTSMSMSTSPGSTGSMMSSSTSASAASAASTSPSSTASGNEAARATGGFGKAELMGLLGLGLLL